MSRSRWLVLVVVPLLLAAEGPSAKDLLAEARQAAADGRLEPAVKLCSQVLALDAKIVPALALRARLHATLKRPGEAVADYTALLKLEPDNAEAYDARGSEQFKRGKIAESVADFDRFLKLRPKEANGHWRRGISLYYAGKFEAGRDQFRGYEAVDTNDVENAVWHFLCNARLVGVEKARTEVLKIGKDGRVPMMAVYDLFQGKAKPQDVLAAATAGNPPAALRDRQLFYAHLYLGLYAEITGDAKKTRQHLTEAARLRISHYMGDVAVVHLGLLPKE